jgi:hypothetical protein
LTRQEKFKNTKNVLYKFQKGFRVAYSTEAFVIHSFVAIKSLYS